MKRSKKLLSLVTLIILVTFAFPAFGFARQGQPPKNPIYLKTHTFDPQNNEEPAIPPGLAAKEDAALNKGYGIYLVQFSGPVQDAWLAELAAQGVQALDYIPDNTFKVRMHPSRAHVVRKLSYVDYVGPFHPAFKESPDLDRSQPIGLFTVRPEKGAVAEGLLSDLSAAGAEVLHIENGALVVAAEAGELDAIAQSIDVAWIENYRLPETHNESGGGAVIGSAAANALGYDGSSQVIAIADTGLGGGTAETAHADLPSSRIAGIYNWPGTTDSCWYIINDGSQDVGSGHGTHVTLSAAGGGNPSGVAKGTAPGARVVFQSLENYAYMQGTCASLYPSGYYLTGLPTDLGLLFQEAYNAGARIHSNSWGSAVNGDYTANSMYADNFVWTHPDMLVSFSAGNEGKDANSDGVIDNDSISAPATAKNVLTVGASENQRSDEYPCDASLTYNSCAAQGGKNLVFTYGSGWPSKFPVSPISSDPSAGNAGQMAAFSSRGPTDDGRIKPDVVAPGTWVLSGYSDMYQQGYDTSPNPRSNAFQDDGNGFPYSQAYKYFSGTSMANPLTAGGAAVVRDYFFKAQGLQPSAALVKAMLINSATDLLDENNDGANDNDYPIPNTHEGWGRVNLAAAVDGSAKFVDQSQGLTTGGGQSQYYTIGTAGAPFKVTLVWSDYPSTEAAAINLVNDLDLVVTAPDGTVYRGNAFSGGWSITGGGADRLNNVENVYVASAQAGTWSVQVNGYNIPQGPQPFALVVDGLFGEPGPTPTTPPVEPTPTDTPEPTATPLPTATPEPTLPPVTLTSGFVSPTANAALRSKSGDNNGFELNPANAYLSDNLYAADMNSGSGNQIACDSVKKDRHQFYSFNLNVPANAVIQGIEVKAEGKADSASNTPFYCIELSWNGGASWTAWKTTSYLTTADTVYLLGGAGDLWGRSWTAAELSNLRVRITSVASSTSRDFYLDSLSVQVTYQQ